MSAFQDLDETRSKIHNNFESVKPKGVLRSRRRTGSLCLVLLIHLGNYKKSAQSEIKNLNRG